MPFESIANYGFVADSRGGSNDDMMRKRLNSVGNGRKDGPDESMKNEKTEVDEELRIRRMKYSDSLTGSQGPRNVWTREGTTSSRPPLTNPDFSPGAASAPNAHLGESQLFVTKLDVSLLRPASMHSWRPWIMPFCPMDSLTGHAQPCMRGIGSFG